jgi:hypothetical protein
VQVAPSLQRYFTPTNFLVHHDDTSATTVMQPLELTRNVAPESMTVQNLIFERFWDIIRRQSGRVPEGNQLLLHRPGNDANDPCSQALFKQVGKDVKKWQAGLQMCHEAGWRRCDFVLIDENADEAAVHAAFQSALMGQERARGWMLRRPTMVETVLWFLGFLVFAAVLYFLYPFIRERRQGA